MQCILVRADFLARLIYPLMRDEAQVITWQAGVLLAQRNIK